MKTLVIAEHDNSRLATATLNAVTAAARFGGEIDVLVAGQGCEGAVAQAQAIAGVARVLVVEQSHGAQFHRYLRAHYDLPGSVRAFHRPGPLPIRPNEIFRQLADWS